MWQEERYSSKEGGGGGRGEAEAWADPWARRKTPPQRAKKKSSRTRSYSSGSSSRSSSRSSRSSSYSSYSRSRSGSKSSKSSRSSVSKSSSRSRSPPNRRLGGGRFNRNNTVMIKGRPVPVPITDSFGRNPRESTELRDPRLTIPRRPMELKVPKVEPRDKVDAFGRIPKKIAERNYSPPTSLHRSPPGSRSHGRAGNFSSRSRSRSRSSSASSRSRSKSVVSRSVSSSSRSSSSSSNDSNDERAERRRLNNANLISYGQSNKAKAIDPMKISGQKQQIKLTLKAPTKKMDKPTALLDDQSGDSDDEGSVLHSRKRKAQDAPGRPMEQPPAKIASLEPAVAAPQKKSTLSRRDELLKQLRAVEDAIKRKRSKLPT